MFWVNVRVNKQLNKMRARARPPGIQVPPPFVNPRERTSPHLGALSPRSNSVTAERSRDGRTESRAMRAELEATLRRPNVGPHEAFCIWNSALQQIVKQVSLHCSDRGELLDAARRFLISRISHLEQALNGQQREAIDAALASSERQRVSLQVELDKRDVELKAIEERERKVHQSARWKVAAATTASALSRTKSEIRRTGSVTGNEAESLAKSVIGLPPQIRRAQIHWWLGRGGWHGLSFGMGWLGWE